MVWPSKEDPPRGLEAENSGVFSLCLMQIKAHLPSRNLRLRDQSNRLGHLRFRWLCVAPLFPSMRVSAKHVGFGLSKHSIALWRGAQRHNDAKKKVTRVVPPSTSFPLLSFILSVVFTKERDGVSHCSCTCGVLSRYPCLCVSPSGVVACSAPCSVSFPLFLVFLGHRVHNQDV